MVNGRIAAITGAAATESDDAIQLIVEIMEQEDIAFDQVRRLHSERKPSPEWLDYFEQNWPKIAITWNFEPGEDAELERAVEELFSQKKPPWWKFW